MSIRLPTSRKIATAMYLAYCLAGIAFVIAPYATVREEASATNAAIWHVFLIFGSLTCLVGVMKKQFLVEGFGLPLLWAALAAYAVILFFSGYASGSPVPIGVGFLVMGAWLGLFDRAVKVYDLIRIDKAMEGRE